MIGAASEASPTLVLGVFAFLGVLVTAAATVIVAKINTVHRTSQATALNLLPSNGDTLAQSIEATRKTTEATRAFQIAHDVDDVRRFGVAFQALGLPVELAQSHARDALVVDRRVTSQQEGEDVPPFSGDVRT